MQVLPYPLQGIGLAPQATLEGPSIVYVKWFEHV